MAAPKHGEGIFAELEERVQALYRPYLPKGVPERILLLLISFIQACPGLAAGPRHGHGRIKHLTPPQLAQQEMQ